VLVLASASRYRRELLERLRLEFMVDVPDLDESALPGEQPAGTARRLARQKAQVVAQRHPGAIVIGSDQVAELDGIPIGKPRDHDDARAQLRRQSGRLVSFHTALCVVGARAGALREALETVQVQFRVLGEATIEAYLRAEEPYDCAGSAKCEGLGIALLDSISSTDPTALIGLPLIRLSALLAEAGLAVLPS
jgi:septum formation protein